MSDRHTLAFKESILKVFKTATGAPDLGSVIAVKRRTPSAVKPGEGDKMAPEALSKCKHRRVNHVDMGDLTLTVTQSKPGKEKERPADNGDSSCHPSSRKKTFYQREKRRKSRAERSKNQTTHKQVDPFERSEFRKHIQKAKEISSRSHIDRVVRIPSESHSFITKSRMTRSIGIFNKGKKSSRVFRAPIEVPDHVLEEVDRDIRRMVGGCSSPTVPARPTCDSVMSGGAISPPFFSQQRKSQTESTTRSNRSYSSVVHDDPRKEVFPEVPSIPDITQEFMKSLDLKMVFPGRDYFKEVQEALLKTMKQNGANKIITVPENNLPRSAAARKTPGIDVILKRKSESNRQPLFLNQDIPHTATSIFHQEPQPLLADTVQSSSQDGTLVDLRLYEPQEAAQPVCSTKYQSTYQPDYQPDYKSRALDSISDTLPFMKPSTSNEHHRQPRRKLNHQAKNPTPEKDLLEFFEIISHQPRPHPQYVDPIFHTYDEDFNFCPPYESDIPTCNASDVKRSRLEHQTFFPGNRGMRDYALTASNHPAELNSDLDGDLLNWLPRYISPMRIPKLQSPSPPKQYPRKMF